MTHFLFLIKMVKIEGYHRNIGHSLAYRRFSLIMLLTSFCPWGEVVTYLIDIFWGQKINYDDQLSCIFFFLERRCHPAIGWVSLSQPRIWNQEVLLGSYSQIRHCSFAVRYFSIHMNLLLCLSINSVPGWRNRMFFFFFIAALLVATIDWVSDQNTHDFFSSIFSSLQSILNIRMDYLNDGIFKVINNLSPIANSLLQVWKKISIVNLVWFFRSFFLFPLSIDHKALSHLSVGCFWRISFSFAISTTFFLALSCKSL